MSEHIGFRCPDDIIAAIKQQMETSGKGRTEVLVEMLRSAMPSMLIGDRAKLPTEAVIYFVWGGQRLLYVGRTSNLRKRFVNHHRLADFVLAEREVRVSWLPASDENLKVFESSLIEELDPEMNHQSKAAENKSKVVSFKLSDEEYETLAALQAEGETSPSIAARRIVKDALGLPVTGLSTPVDSQIDERIQQAIAPLREQIEQLKRVVSPPTVDKTKAEEIPIEALELSSRVYGSLKKQCLHAVSDILRYNLEDLQRVAGIGPASAEEIVEALQSRGFYLQGMNRGEQAA